MADNRYADASYDLIMRDDGTVQVVIAMPEMSPTRVSGFPSHEKAEAWVAEHRIAVASGNVPKDPNRKSIYSGGA